MLAAEQATLDDGGDIDKPHRLQVAPVTITLDLSFVFDSV